MKDKIKLDQNISQHLRGVLEQLGHDVDTVADEGLSGATDIKVITVATTHQRILFTLDRGFLDLRKYPPASHAGIVVFRPPRQGAAAIARFVTAFVRSVDLRKYRQRTTLVERTRVRVFK